MTSGPPASNDSPTSVRARRPPRGRRRRRRVRSAASASRPSAGRSSRVAGRRARRSSRRRRCRLRSPLRHAALSPAQIPMRGCSPFRRGCGGARKLGRLVAEAAQEDELSKARSLCLPSHRFRCPAVVPLEVLASERVHQVVRDVDALEGTAHRRAVGHVGDRPANCRLLRRAAGATRRRRSCCVASSGTSALPTNPISLAGGRGSLGRPQAERNRIRRLCAGAALSPCRLTAVPGMTPKKNCPDVPGDCVGRNRTADVGLHQRRGHPNSVER